MEKIYNKLVRDKIPEIIVSNGERPIVRLLDDNEYKKELEKKLYEEYLEVLAAASEDRVEELADMLEIISCLAILEDSNLDVVVQKMDEKRNKRGGFVKKIFLERVE